MESDGPALHLPRDWIIGHGTDKGCIQGHQPLSIDKEKLRRPDFRHEIVNIRSRQIITRCRDRKLRRFAIRPVKDDIQCLLHRMKTSLASDRHQGRRFLANDCMRLAPLQIQQSACHRIHIAVWNIRIYMRKRQLRINEPVICPYSGNYERLTCQPPAFQGLWLWV